MADHSVALQTAIFGVLCVDATLVSLIGDGASPERARVFDAPRSNTEFPYVTIGDDIVVDVGDKSKDRQEFEIYIHTWDRADEQSTGHRGRKPTKDVMEAIYDALHATTPVVSGASTIYLYWQFSDTFQEPDGLTWHGVSRFRAVIEDT